MDDFESDLLDGGFFDAADLYDQLKAAKHTRNAASSQQLEYWYDDSGYYAYILLNANQQTLANVIQELGKIQIRVLHYGRSYRPADNGRQYNWFIRVANTDYSRPTLIHIEKFFADRFRIDTADTTQKKLEAEYDNLRAEHERKEHERREYLAQARRREEQKQENDRKSYERQINSLRLQIKALLKRSDLNKQERENVETNTNVTWEQIAEHLDNDLKQNEAQIAELRDLVDEKADEFESNKLELEETKIQLSQAQKELERLNIGKSRNNPKKFLETLLKPLLPNVDFMPGSLDILADLFPNCQPVLEIIYDVAIDKELKNKTVKNVRGRWNKEHFLTGRDDHGRVYFTKDKATGKYVFLISFKNEQDHDFARMDKY